MFRRLGKTAQEKVELDTDNLLYEDLRSSNKMLWVFSFTCLAALVIVSSYAWNLSQKFDPQFKVITVDKLTGATGLAQTIEEYGNPKNTEMNHKAYIKRFLTSYRQYNYPLLQRDYDTVKSLSSPAVWDNYAKQFEGPNSLEIKYGKKLTIIPTNLSVIPSKFGFANVRYELVITDDSGIEKRETRNATVRYEFVANLKMTEAQAMDNPFGFKVLAVDETLEEKK